MKTNLTHYNGPFLDTSVMNDVLSVTLQVKRLSWISCRAAYVAVQRGFVSVLPKGKIIEQYYLSGDLIFLCSGCKIKNGSVDF